MNVYVNDLNVCLANQCKIVQYADDTCIFISGNRVQDIVASLAINVEKLTYYFQAHSLSLNVEKTQCIVISSKRNNKSICAAKLNVFGTLIEQAEHVKYLGINIDRNLTFDSYVSEKWQ